MNGDAGAGGETETERDLDRGAPDGVDGLLGGALEARDQVIVGGGFGHLLLVIIVGAGLIGHTVSSSARSLM